MADVVIVEGEPVAEAEPIVGAEAEAVATEVVVEAAVEIAEIEAERDVAIAEIQAETTETIVEAEAERSNNTEERLEQCLNSIEVLTTKVEMLAALSIQAPLILEEEALPSLNNPESGEVDPPEVAEEPAEPKPQSRGRKLRWI